MDTLNKLVKEWETKVNKAATTKIHQCLVRNTRIKRTINEALNPVERGEKSLKRPGTTQLVSTPKEVSSIFSPTLLTLGGSLEYAPPSTLVDRLLTHSPNCPEPTKHSPLPDITWESFRKTLKRSKPNKAGGGTSQTTTLCTFPPPPIQQFIWRVCNHYLRQPLPGKWLEANIILLLKKGDVMNPINYRPIGLLSSVYKIIATHVNRELLAAAIEHSIIHPTQFGGLPNRRCQDNIFNLLHTIKDPGLRCNEKEYTFQNPAISVRPQLAGCHELLTPPLLHPQEYILNPPPGPHGGVLLDSSLHGELYWLPDEPHSLDPDDLEEWGCEAALALLLTSSPGKTWVYLDGSAGALGYGSATTLFFPNGSRWVLCQTSTYQSSEGSEFWAAIMFLRWALASHPHLTFAVLGDNLHVITVLSPSTPQGLPSRSPAGTWESSLRSIQASLRPGMTQGSGWIKWHAGFVGNEISDAYSKWAAHVMIWDPSLLPPPPIGCISRGPHRVIHKRTTTSIKHLLPCHKQENIHAPSSFHFYNHTSWFNSLPFKWSSGNFNMAPFAFHDDLCPRQCHACPDQHPMDVITFVSHCPTCELLVQTYIQCWRPPFHHGGIPMVVRDHTRQGEAQFRPGACPHVPVHQTDNPPLRPKKSSTLS